MFAYRSSFLAPLSSRLSIMITGDGFPVTDANTRPM
jgi:hypothetical protein